MAAGSSLYHLTAGTHPVRIEQLSLEGLHARVDIAFFALDHSPVASSSWGSIKALY